MITASPASAPAPAAVPSKFAPAMWSAKPLFDISAVNVETTTFKLGPIKREEISHSSSFAGGIKVRQQDFTRSEATTLADAVAAARVVADKGNVADGYELPDRRGAFSVAIMQGRDGTFWLSGPRDSLSSVPNLDGKWWGNDRQQVRFEVTAHQPALKAVVLAKVEQPFVFSEDERTAAVELVDN